MRKIIIGTIELSTFNTSDVATQCERCQVERKIVQKRANVGARINNDIYLKKIINGICLLKDASK